MISLFTNPRGARRIAGAALLLTLLPLATAGCFGRFQVTRNLYKWNQNVSQDKWLRWVAFLLLACLPYGLVITIDALITNSIEFWTGKNPVTVTSLPTRVFAGPEGSQVVMALQPDRTIAVVITAADGSQQRLFLAQDGASVTARDAEGVLLARVSDLDGRAALIEGSLAAATAR